MKLLVCTTGGRRRWEYTLKEPGSGREEKTPLSILMCREGLRHHAPGEVDHQTQASS